MRGAKKCCIQQNGRAAHGKEGAEQAGDDSQPDPVAIHLSRRLHQLDSAHGLLRIWPFYHIVCRCDTLQTGHADGRRPRTAHTHCYDSNGLFAMYREYYKGHSSGLGREMELLVFGHTGLPVIAFPTSGGRFFEFEDKGMIGALADRIDTGQLQLFCVDSVNMESWYNRQIPPAFASRDTCSTRITCSTRQCL